MNHIKYYKLATYTPDSNTLIKTTYTKVTAQTSWEMFIVFGSLFNRETKHSVVNYDISTQQHWIEISQDEFEEASMASWGHAPG